MEKLKFIGRGSAFNIKEGNTSAYMKEGENLLLIDCGETVFRDIIKKNILEGIKNIYILITHFHSDHIGSLSSLICYCNYVKDIKVKIYYPDVEALLNFLVSQGNHLNTWTYFDIANDEEELRKLKITNISYMQNNHDKIEKITTELIDNEQIMKSRKDLFLSFSIIIYKENNCILYSGDTNKLIFKDLLNLYRIKNGNLNNIIVYQDVCLKDNTIHLSIDQLEKEIPEEFRQNVYCMHIDCEEVILKAKEKGFNVVECE